MSQTAAASPRRRWLKLALVLVVLLILGLGVLVAFAPAIVSGLAPGMAKSAAKGMIAGELSIGSASLSWAGPQKFSGVELRDPKGGLIASVNAEATAGLWSLITGSRDLGTLTLTGKADLIKSADGTTNLQQAVAEPLGKTAATKAPSSAPVKLPGGLQAKLLLNGVDVRYKEVDAAGAMIGQSALTDLRGEASVSTLAGTATAQAKLAGVVGDGKAAGALSISIKLDHFADGQGLLTLGAATADVAVDTGEMPVALLDALANLKGLLVEALGPVAKINLTAKGDAAAGSAALNVQSENVTTALALRLENGKVVSEKPGAISIRSTRFLSKAPGMSAALARAGVSIDTWPSIDAKMTSLTLPIPKTASVSGLDLRGIGLDIEVKTSTVNGRITPPGSSEGSAAAKPQSFELAPATLTIAAPDLAQGLNVSASTSAMLDRQSAGTLGLDVRASGLLDGQGRLALRDGLPGRITGSLSAKGVATTLAQPFLAAANTPIDLAADVGPTVEMTANFDTSQLPDSLSGGSRPPLEVDATVQSRNIKLRAPLRLDGGVMTSRGETTLEVVSAGGLIRRVLAKQAEAGADSPIRVTGDAGLKVSATDIRVPLSMTSSTSASNASAKPKTDLDLSTIGAQFSLQLSRLDVAVVRSNAGPIGVQQLSMTGRLQPGKTPELTVAGSMSHEGHPFLLDASLSFPSFDSAFASTQPGAMIPGVGPMRVIGSIKLSDLPMSLAKLAPSGPKPASGQAESGALADELTRGLMGDRATVTLALDQVKGGGESYSVQVRGAGLSMEASGDFGASQARLASCAAELTVTPETIRGILKATGQDKGDLAQVNMRSPARLALTVQPVSIPLAMNGGTPRPDWSRAGPAQLGVTLREPLIVSGLPLNEKRLTGGVRDLVLSADVPLSMLGEGGKSGEPMKVALRSKLLLDEGRGVGELVANASVPSDLSAVDATVTVTGLNTVTMDGVLDQPLLVSGALGGTADVSFSMRQELKAARAEGAAAPIRAKIQVSKSPRLTTEPLDILIDGERFALMAPAKASWTIDPTWADRYLLAPKEPGQHQAYRLLTPTSVSLDIRRLAVARSDVRGGLVVAGPMKPGVFSVDLTANIPKVQIQPLSSEAGEANRSIPMTLDNISAEITSAADNSLKLNVKTASVAGGGVTSAAPVTLVGSIRDLAAGNGAFNAEGFVADLELKADSAPTALIDAVAGMNGRLVDLLGPQLKATVTTTSFTRRPGGKGEIVIDVRSYRPTSAEPAALVSLSAPVVDGVISVAAPKPMRMELAEFNVGEGSALVQSFGIIASMSKQRLNAEGKADPVRITSANLRLPLGSRRGELKQLNGDIDVALGTVNYTLRTGFASLIQSGMVKDLTRSVQQPPMKPFRVAIRNGVAEYSGVEIPLKIGLGLGEEIVNVPLSGKINLVDELIDVQASLPLELVSGTVLSVLPIGLSGLRGDLLGFLERKDDKSASADPKAKERAEKARTIRVPVRVHGPMDKPAFDVDVELFGRSSGGLLDDLTRRPGETIKGIGESIGELFKKPGK